MKKLILLFVALYGLLASAEAQKISQLTPASTITDSDLYITVQGGANFSVTAAQIKNYVGVTSVTGTQAIGNGVDFVTISGLGLTYTPSLVIVTMTKVTGGLNIFAIVRSDSVSTSGFTVDLSAATDAATYKLNYQLIK
jgi:hypothetical protein